MFITENSTRKNREWLLGRQDCVYYSSTWRCQTPEGYPLWGAPHLHNKMWTMPQKLCPADKLGFLFPLCCLGWKSALTGSLLQCFHQIASYPETFPSWPNGQVQLNAVWEESQTSLAKPRINKKFLKIEMPYTRDFFKSSYKEDAPSLQCI